MNMNNTPQLLGQQMHVDVRAIERELSALWQQAAEGANGEKSSAVTRMCVLNLIVVAGGGRALQQTTEIVGQLTASHPNRAIVVSSVPDAREDLLDAWVQVHCQMPGPGRPQVCCEQITIAAHGQALGRVPGTVLPLLVPDVPVMLWWPRGEPFDNPLFTKLSHIADRVIVDSDTFAAPEAGLPRLVGLIDADTAISDLAWGRLTPWRELVAQFFDVPTLLPHLNEIVRVVVEYEALPEQPVDRSPALLLIGWLASRLDWRMADGWNNDTGSAALQMRAANASEVLVELRTVQPKEDTLDRLASLTIECRRARFSVTRGQAATCAIVRTDAESMRQISRTVHLEQPQIAKLLVDELRLLGRDRAFEGALKAAAQLV